MTAPIFSKRVFISHDNGQLDFTKAKAFGEIVPVFTGRVDIFHPERVKASVEKGLEKFDASKDYILLSGSTLPSAFALAWLVLHAEDGRKADDVIVKFLIFDAKRDNYFSRSVKI